ncbi:hypothetical protein QQ020_30250 [Fulvivirgaceae bacterium BMA12]|uniref:YD repeat-containing protein n=1 Tax=Agaribacillus aureus TaxID=3051825 RepID=A0ABT8LF27_9BACT|nr:hypothetical protein [Fulvivirgaceae bacterium BMA12]
MKTAFVTFILIVLGSCHDNIRLQRFPDPFRETFRGKNIRLAMVYADTTNVDTIVFDEKGNLILRNTLWSKLRYDYDSLGYLTRYYLLNDAPLNFLIQYEYEGDDIIQNWYPINSTDWDYEKNDLKSEIEKAFRFKKDREGKIVEEYNLLNGDSTLFTYDNLSNLISKKTYSNDKLKQKIEYKYFDGGSDLYTIKYWNDLRLLRTDYFSESGLVDSTVYRHYTKKYDYVYY